MLGLEGLCLEIVSCDCGDSPVLKTLDPEGFSFRLGSRGVQLKVCGRIQDPGSGFRIQGSGFRV